MLARFLFPTIFLLLSVFSHAQELSQVTFSGGANLVYFSLMTDQGVLLRISDDGTLLEWGTEAKAINGGEYYAPRLQPFAGRVDYYGVEGDSISRGKIKMIGVCQISYYSAFEDSTHAGKVRSIGRVFLDYYNKYDNKTLRGKLKMIGSHRLEYFSEFENEAYRGKLKSIGNTQLTYYSNFDDRNNSGKIKSIGPSKYVWYTSFDRRDMGGGLKVGFYRQAVNGITYILW